MNRDKVTGKRDSDKDRVSHLEDTTNTVVVSMVTHVIGRQPSTDTQTWHHTGTATTSQGNTVSPYKEP